MATKLDIGVEGVAVRRRLLLEAGREPFLALLRRPVCPGLLVHLALGLLLDAIVADDPRGVERLVDLLPRDGLEEAGVYRVATPHAGEAICLEFRAHRAALGAGIASGLEQAEKVLDVVAVLMREDVLLREFTALRTELRLELVEEAEVDVDGLVDRAVERSDSARGATTLGVHLTVEEDRPGLGELLVRGGERLGPVRPQAIDGTDDPAILALVGIGPGLTFRCQLAGNRSGRRLTATRASGQIAEIAAEQDDHRQEYEASEPAPDGDSATAHAPAASAAPILHLTRVELDIRAKGHGLVFSVCTSTVALGAHRRSIARSVPTGPARDFRGMAASALAEHDQRDMPPDATTNARSSIGRVLNPWRVAPAWARVGDDPYLFYTATLVPIVLLVALVGQRAGDLPMAILLSSLAIAVQAMLGYLGKRHRLAAKLGWQLLRLLPPLAFVAVASRLIGGPSLPLLALYVPIVAGAAAAGRAQGSVAAGLAAVVLLSPELTTLGSTNEIAVRGVTLAGVTLVLAYSTRRIVRALEDALTASRSAVKAERRRASQISALEVVGRLLAADGLTGEALERIVDVIVSRFNYQYVSVYLGDAERVQLVVQHGYVDPLDSFDAFTGIAGRVMRIREVAFVPDVASDPDYVPGTYTPTSLICAPLIVDGRFLGILSVDSTRARLLDETDRSLVVIMATRIAAAVALGQDRQALPRAPISSGMSRPSGARSAALCQ